MLKVKTIQSTALMLLFIIIISNALLAFFDFGLKHNFNLKSAFIVSHPPSAKILVLGPCEPLWMVDPAIISKNTGKSCYNLSLSHSDFADNYLHLYLYLQKNPPPSQILLFVTPESFDLRYNNFHPYRFAPWREDTAVQKVIADCQGLSFSISGVLAFSSYLPYTHQLLFSAIQGWKHFLSGKDAPYFPDGFEPPAKIIWDNHYSDLMHSYTKGYKFNWSPLRGHYLEEILKLCGNLGIRVLCFESPIWKGIAGYQLNRDNINQRIDSIAGKWDTKIIRFDHLKWAADRKWFISPMVTNLAGSSLFSDTLGKYLQRELLTKY